MTEQEIKNSVIADNAENTVPTVTDQPVFADTNSAVSGINSELTSLQTDEQDQKLLDALDKILEKHNKRLMAEEQVVPTQPKRESAAVKFKRKGIGFISLSLVLIFLGVMLLYTLFSPKHDFMLLLKLSPICAILIGLEILFAQIITHGRYKINIPSILVSGALTVGCCFMCTALNDKLTEKNEEYNNRSIAAEIYDMSYQELRYIADIAKVDVSVDLNPKGDGIKEGVNSLSTDDIVNVSVRIGGVIENPRDFARTSKEIINAYRIMGINVTNFKFSNESTLHTYTLDVEGKFAQDYSEDELLADVNHIYLKNMGYLEDLQDLTEETDSDKNK